MLISPLRLVIEGSLRPCLKSAPSIMGVMKRPVAGAIEGIDMKRLLTCGAVAVALIATAGASFAQDADDLVRDLAVVQKPIYDMSIPAGAIEVSARLDKPAGSYRVGDEVRISVSADRTSYITVINVGTSGKTTVLFPNSKATYNRVRPGQVLTFPAPNASWAIQAQGPGGVEVIKVFASTSPNSLFAGGKYRPAGPFRAFDGSSEEAVRDLGLVIKQQPAATRWGSATLLFRVR